MFDNFQLLTSFQVPSVFYVPSSAWLVLLLLLLNEVGIVHVYQDTPLSCALKLHMNSNVVFCSLPASLVFPGNFFSSP